MEQTTEAFQRRKKLTQNLLPVKDWRELVSKEPGKKWGIIKKVQKLKAQKYVWKLWDKPKQYGGENSVQKHHKYKTSEKSSCIQPL